MMSNEEMAQRIQNGEREFILPLWQQNAGIFNIKAFGLYNRYRKRCASSGVEPDDIIQIAYFAMLDAVKAYRPDGEYKFTAYIKFPLLTRFNDLIGLRGKRDPLNHAASLDEEIGGEDNELTRRDLISDPESEKPFETVTDNIFIAELHDALEKSISKLDVKRAAVIRGRYFEDKTQKDIAAKMGVSHQFIRQIEVDGLRKLSRERSLKAFHEEILSNMAYKHTGLTKFRTTWASSVELAVLKAEELTNNRHKARFRN